MEDREACLELLDDGLPYGMATLIAGRLYREIGKDHAEHRVSFVTSSTARKCELYISYDRSTPLKIATRIYSQAERLMEKYAKVLRPFFPSDFS